MTEFLPGGRRRIDRVLAPGYIDGVETLDLEELRVRRADADQEEVDLSYARRLLQGRLDILRAEQACRRGDGDPSSSRARTSRSSPPSRASSATSSARRVVSAGTSRRRPLAGSASTAARRSAPSPTSAVPTRRGLDDVALAEAIANLADIESRISRSRRQVQAVVDLLTEEIARRYQAGEVTAGAR